MVGGSYARGENCGVPVGHYQTLSERFHQLNLSESCSSIALAAHYLSLLLPSSLSLSAYNLAVSGCGYMCLVESIQSYYLLPHAETLHVVFIDVCINDNLAPTEEMEIAYIEVVSFVRKRGGEVVFVCSWSDFLYRHPGSPKINYDLAPRKDWVVTPYGFPDVSPLTYNRCSVVGIRYSERYLFPVIEYLDSLLAPDGSYSGQSEKYLDAVLPALTRSYDNAHPSIFGNDYVAQTLSRWLYWRICHVLSLTDPLPQPFIPLLNSSTSSLVQLFNTAEAFKAIVRGHRGFEWRVEPVNKPGWISETFGSVLLLKLPVPVSAGYLSLGFLQTYSSIAVFNLTVTNGNVLVANRRVMCAITRKFSQTAFVTIAFNVTNGDKFFRIQIEHIDHTDVARLKRFEDMKKFVFDFGRGHFGKSNATKVKIISVGIYDSDDGLASRPREVDYSLDEPKDKK